MTTGATIHTTEGLKMTVARRRRPSIITTLQTPTVEEDSSIIIPMTNTVCSQKDEVPSARS